ncbi:hypothetical protein C0992_006140, partial [Termitomyces sp. T32_za158]
MHWEPPIPASTGPFAMGQGAAYITEANIATYVPAHPRSLQWDGLSVPPVQLPPSPLGQGNAPKGAGDACSWRRDRIVDYMRQSDKVLRSIRTTGNLLRDDPALRKELARLVEEIHVSPSPGQFEDPADLAYSFHVQRNPEATGEPRFKDPTQGAEQHISNLDAASALLQELNPLGGLFDQPAARVVGLSARPRANSVPSA